MTTMDKCPYCGITEYAGHTCAERKVSELQAEIKRLREDCENHKRIRDNHVDANRAAQAECAELRRELERRLHEVQSKALRMQASWNIIAGRVAMIRLLIPRSSTR
jgi:DNA repair exonuclease SbcCD ATPase subunit